MVTGALALMLAENKTNFFTGSLTTLLPSDGKDIDNVNSSAYQAKLGTRLDLKAFLADAF